MHAIQNLLTVIIINSHDFVCLFAFWAFFQLYLWFMSYSFCNQINIFLLHYIRYSPTVCTQHVCCNCLPLILTLKKRGRLFAYTWESAVCTRKREPQHMWVGATQLTRPSLCREETCWDSSAWILCFITTMEKTKQIDGGERYSESSRKNARKVYTILLSLTQKVG